MTRNASFAPSRRQVLAGLGSTFAASVLPVAPGRAAFEPFRRDIGSLEVMVLSDGTLSVPLGFTLPETPLPEIEAVLNAHGLSPRGMPSQTNATIVKAGDELVLIDTGSGSNFQPTAGKLAENMQAAGIDPESITKVVFTHGHADHLWGTIDDLDEERFPKASYVISVTEWDFWTDPSTFGRAPDWMRPMAQAAARILKRIEGKLERRKAGEAVAPGLTYVETVGHTPGHMSVMVENGRERVLIGGDVLTHAALSFARPGWRMGSDHDRDRAVATRRRVLDQLAADRIPLIGYHLPWPGHGIVERKDGSYRFVPV